MADVPPTSTVSTPAKQPAPPYLTGGGGFVVESQVTASMFAAMLAGLPPEGFEDGIVKSVALQVRPNGWLLDDVLLTMTTTDGADFSAALSVKSDQQFGVDSPPQSFVNDAWRQYLHEDAGTDVFQRDRDYLALVTAPLSSELHRQLHDLLNKAGAQTATDLTATVAMPKVGSETKRALLAGFACPTDLFQKHGPALTSTGTFLRRLRFLEHDFDSIGSKSKRRAIAMCRELVVSGALRDAIRLWRSLIGIADELRPKKGSVDRASLISRLRKDHRLKDYPEHLADFERIRASTITRLGTIRDAIGDRITLLRQEALDRIGESLASRARRVLVGPSGSGKTGLAKRIAAKALAKGHKVIWIDADRLNQMSVQALEGEWRLDHALSELMSSVPESEAYLVLDGLEKLNAVSAFAAVSALLQMAPAPWRVIATCILEEWDRVRVALAGANLPVDSIQATHISPPSDAELAPVWSAIPALQRLAARFELRELLLRVKILDLFARNLQILEATDPSKFAGESDLIDWFWRHVVDRPPDGPSRATLARMIATIQADAAVGSIPEDEIAPSDVASLSGLCVDTVCSRDDGRVRFDHDLYGDWSRRQVLLSRGKEIGKFMAARFHNPTWNRAVRLFALHLLETKKDLVAWQNAIRSFESDGRPTVAGDLMLEAVLFSGNSYPILEQLWPLLSANQGALFIRLLDRFRHAASVPHPLFPDDPEERIPNRIYWPPIIRFIHARMAEAAAVAPREVAEIVDLWLRQGGSKWPCRREAAEVAIALAKRALHPAESERYHFRHAEIPLYRAVLAAARDLPTEVRDFVLTAAERAPLPAASTAEDERDHGTSLIGLLTGSPNLPPPSSPDAPHRRPDSEFAKVCHNWRWLAPLISSQPSIAREALLATIVMPPVRRNDFGWSRDHDISNCAENHGREWYPPFWFRGPFYTFLKSAPDEGLEVILRLINFVTARWSFERETDDEAPVEVEIHMPYGQCAWAGDNSVYYAYLDLGRFPHSACSALMALEKYLYDEIDAGRSVDALLQKILRRSTSVAFAGVLSAVGHKHPALFETVLRPLLGVPEFLSWEYQHAALRPDKTTASISWSMSSPDTLQFVREWFNMPHRSMNLRDTACGLFLTRHDMQLFFESARNRWHERCEAGEIIEGMFDLERLSAFFDPANYRRTKVDGGIAIEWVKPEKLRLADDAHQERRRISDIVLMLPGRCARILEEGRALSDGELETLWKTLQEIDAVAAQDKTVRDGPKADSLCGGVALLLLRHREWVKKDASRERWCFETLARIVTNPPAPADYDSSNSKYPWGWDRFAAQVVPLLWAEQPTSHLLKELTARLLFSRHYETVAHLFKAVAPLQARLGDEYWRLWHLGLRWSALRWRGERASRLRSRRRGKAIGSAMDQRLAAELDSFIKNTLAPSLPNLQQIAARPVYKKRGTIEPRLDLDVLTAMLGVVPSLDEVAEQTERNGWNQLWRQVVQLLVERARPPHSNGDTDDDEHDSLPYDDERDLLGLIARAIARTREDDQPELLWQPLLSLPDAGRHWVEAFLEDWLSIPLRPDQIPGVFSREWARMSQFCSESAIWKSNSHERASLREKLLGIGTIAARYWGSEHRDLVANMIDRYKTYADSELSEQSRLADFCTFLCYDAAEGLLLTAIQWIAKLDWISDPKNWWRDHDREAVCRFLNRTWNKHEATLRADAQALSGFRTVVAAMTACREPIALELQDRMARGEVS